MSPNRRLDQLFAAWQRKYPREERSGFSRDGIIDEALYKKEKERILFILQEPNTTGSKYGRYNGCDLRSEFYQPKDKKEVFINIALWARAILDGKQTYQRFNNEEAALHIRRVAIMNLKKIGGSGKADMGKVKEHAWQYRSNLSKQLEIINPTVIVVCGDKTNEFFAQVVCNDSECSQRGEVWSHKKRQIILANHPSCRPKDAPSALRKIVDRARLARIGAYVKTMADSIHVS